MKRLALFAYLSGLGILPTAIQCSAQESWDPPAITVFPDHELAAKSSRATQKLIADGELLFRTKFTRAYGAGRPAATGDSKPTFRNPENDEALIRTAGPDANSCAGCHNQPLIGGSGDFVANVFVGAHFTDPPTHSIDSTVTNERNTLGIFGAGAIEMLAREMTKELHAQRTNALAAARKQGRAYRQDLSAKGVSFGFLTARPDGTYDASELEGVDPDLVVKPFGFKGISISLREFTINSLNQHHGIQAVERFGWERTGMRDFDEDGVETEFTIGQVSALTLFQASLPAPRQGIPPDPVKRKIIDHGGELFSAIGCSRCHVPTLPLRSHFFSEPNPFNRPGNLVPGDVTHAIRHTIPTFRGSTGGITHSSKGELLVHAYTDLKRHRICDEEDPFLCNERLRQDNVPTDQYLTPKLWDVATSAPYGHRGDCATLSEIIVHHSAEARGARNSFMALQDVDKKALIRFLLSLGAAWAPNGNNSHLPRMFITQKGN